jgi:hypothetical protein
MRTRTWIGVAILIFGGIVLWQFLQYSYSNSIEKQKTLDQEQNQLLADRGFSDCMTRAKTDYENREIDSCMAQHHTTADYCMSNLTPIIAGPIYDSYQTDKNNCSIQFPGASIIGQ